MSEPGQFRRIEAVRDVSAPPPIAPEFVRCGACDVQNSFAVYRGVEPAHPVQIKAFDANFSDPLIRRGCGIKKSPGEIPGLRHFG